MSTARLRALEDCLRKRADRLLEINQQQQRRLETKLHRLHVQSMETIFAHKRSKEMFEKQYSYLYDIVERSPSRKEDDGISKDLFLPQMKSMTRYPWQNNTDRIPRYMAVVRTNNIVYFSGQKPQLKGYGQPVKQPQKQKSRYFHASSLLLQEENYEKANNQNKQMEQMKMKIPLKLRKIQATSFDKLAVDKVYEENDRMDTSALIPIIKFSVESSENQSRKVKPRVLRFSLPSLY